MEQYMLRLQTSKHFNRCKDFMKLFVGNVNLNTQNLRAIVKKSNVLMYEKYHLTIGKTF